MDEEKEVLPKDLEKRMRKAGYIKRFSEPLKPSGYLGTKDDFNAKFKVNLSPEDLGLDNKNN